MDEAGDLEAEVDESTEIDDVLDGPLDESASLQFIQRNDVLACQWLGKFTAGIAAGLTQLFQNIADGLFART